MLSIRGNYGDCLVVSDHVYFFIKLPSMLTIISNLSLCNHKILFHIRRTKSKKKTNLFIPIVNIILHFQDIIIGGKC